MIRIKRVYIIVLLLSIFAACVSYRTERVQVNPPFDHTFINTVAVIEFSNSSNRNGAGKIMADRVEQLLLNESGYQVVGRMDIDQILGEKNLNAKGMLNSSAAKKIGDLLGVNALIVGNVEIFDVTQKGKHTDANVVITFKVLNTSSGRVIWSKTVQGRYRGKYETDFSCSEKAIEHLMKDVRHLFPHEVEKQVAAY